jgi:WD40 repeat protein
MKAMARDAADRYASAEALAEDLRRFLADRPPRARRTPITERAWRWCRRNPAWATLAGAVTLLGAVIVLISTTSALRLRAELARVEHAEQGEREAKHQAIDRLWTSYLAQARAGRVSRRLGQRFDSLKAIEHAAELARQRNMPDDRFLEMRNEAIACLALPDLRLVRDLESFAVPDVHVSFDASLERYARSDREGTIRVRRVSDGTEICRLPDIGPGLSLSVLLSPDGQYLVVGTLERQGGTYELWKVGDGIPVKLLERSTLIGVAAFTADSQRLALGVASGEIELYDLASLRIVQRIKQEKEPRSAAFHPTRDELAVAWADRVRILDLKTGSVLWEFSQEREFYPHLNWHPGGEILASVANRVLYLWDVAHHKQIAKLEGFRNSGITSGFNKCGNLLATGGWEGTVRLWDPLTGKLLLSTPGAYHYFAGLRLDDRFLPMMHGNRLGLWEMVVGHEVFQLVRDPLRDKGWLGVPATFMPERNELAAIGESDGFGIWDLARRRKLGFIPLQYPVQPLFDPHGGLWTSSRFELLHWPVKRDESDAGIFRIGPPRAVLGFPPSPFHIACSWNGDVLAAPEGAGAVVQHRGNRHLVHLAPHADVRQVAVSPDGRWVATGSHQAELVVKVWDSQNGKLAAELPAPGLTRVVFSPDGKWLAASSEQCRLWHVGTWRPGPVLPGNTSLFSPDGRTLAVHSGNGVVRLVDPETAKEYARLQDPDQEEASEMSVSPDGAHLLVSSLNTNFIRAWDLRAIREYLASVGLDWEAPPLPPVERAGRAELAPVEIVGRASPDEAPVIGRTSFLLALNPWNSAAYLRRANAYMRLGDLDKAAADYRAAWRLMPPALRRQAPALESLFAKEAGFKSHARKLADKHRKWGLSAGACNEVAWDAIVATPDERDPLMALAFAERATTLEPDEPFYVNTLGSVYYRFGWYAEAIATLKHNPPDTDAAGYDMAFLAMCHARLGEPEKARKYLDGARKWVRDRQKTWLSPGWIQELDSALREAESVLAESHRR